MAKISVLRKGSKRPVMLPAREAHALVKYGSFTYADAQVSKPKSKAKASNASSGPKAKAPLKAEVQKVQPPKVEEKSLIPSEKTPMSMAKHNLSKMTIAQLRDLAKKEGMTFDAGATRSDIIDTLERTSSARYARRDLRAEE